ncbi:entericidin A/B family lipoprotein [Roseovarius sp. S4756]
MPKFVLALIAVAGLAACNTVEGFGQDVENTGEAIEAEAD